MPPSPRMSQPILPHLFQIHANIFPIDLTTHLIRLCHSMFQFRPRMNERQSDSGYSTDTCKYPPPLLPIVTFKFLHFADRWEYASNICHIPSDSIYWNRPTLIPLQWMSWHDLLRLFHKPMWICPQNEIHTLLDFVIPQTVGNMPSNRWYRPFDYIFPQVLGGQLESRGLWLPRG